MKININPSEPENEMFMCECGGESIMVSKYKGEPDVFLSYWGQGFTPKSLSWWMRIKLSCEVMLGGLPYIDQVVISNATAKKLSAHLAKISKT